MSNALTVGGRPSIIDQINSGLNPFEDLEKGGGDFFGDYLKINGNTGEISYGKDGTELDPGFEVLVDVESIRYGWQCWKDSEPIDERTDFLIGGDHVAEGELPDHGPYTDEQDGWRELYTLRMVLMGETPAEDIKLTYNIASGGGKNALRKLIKAYMKQVVMNVGDDGQAMIPIVEIDLGSFIPAVKKHGKKYFPIFTLKGWEERSVAMEAFSDDAEAGGSDDYDDEPEQKQIAAKPAKKGKVNAKPPEPEIEDVEDENDEGNYDDGEAEVEEKTRKAAPKPRGRGERASSEAEDDDAAEEAAPAPRGRGRGRGR